MDVGDRTGRAGRHRRPARGDSGGRATATHLANDRIPFDADPFGPENRAYVSTGPLQLSQMSFTGRMSMTGLSPLTDGLASTNAGGCRSRNFADAGISVLGLAAGSDELLAVHVTDEGVEFEEVPDLEDAEVSLTTVFSPTSSWNGPEKTDSTCRLPGRAAVVL